MHPLPRFDIHPEVARAHTPDKALYLDDAVWAAVRERVFARGWQWLGPAPEPPVSPPGGVAAAQGWATPLDLLPGLLDEPLLLAQDADGTRRALANVCTHRGLKLLHAPCSGAHMRCRYHGRRFGFDGGMLAAPGFQGACDFPAPADDLARYALESALGHLFVSPALPSDGGPLMPLAEWLAEPLQGLQGLGIEAWAAAPERSRDYEFDAHWALYVENYLEGLHIPFVHPALARQVDLARYEYQLGRWSVLQRALARSDDEPAFERPAGAPDHGRRVAAYYWWLFPNLMLNVYPWGLSVNVVLPQTPTRTRVLFRSFVARPELLERGAGGALDPVEQEDEAVVLGVQKGLRSRAYRRGRYAPAHEAGTHHFHRLLAAVLQGG